MSVRKSLFLLLLFLLLSNTNIEAQKSYTKSQVDSIVAQEVQKQLAAKNAEIELLVEKSSQDKIYKYITEQNNHLTTHDTFMGGIYAAMGILFTLLIGLMGAIFPYMLNKRYEERLDKIAEDNKTEIAKKVGEKAAELTDKIDKHDEKIKAQKDIIDEQQTKMDDVCQKVKEMADAAAESAKKAEAAKLFNQALDEKDLDEKLRLYEEVLKISPNEAKVYNNIGNVYSKKGDNDKAIENYEMAIRLKPDIAEPYNNLGAAYARKGNYDKAIENLDKAINLKPDYTSAYHNKGRALFLKAKKKKEDGDLDSALALAKEGLASAHKGGKKELIENLKDLIRELEDDLD